MTRTAPEAAVQTRAGGMCPPQKLLQTSPPGRFPRTSAPTGQHALGRGIPPCRGIPSLHLPPWPLPQRTHSHFHSHTTVSQPPGRPLGHPTPVQVSTLSVGHSGPDSLPAQSRARGHHLGLLPAPVGLAESCWRNLTPGPELRRDLGPPPCTSRLSREQTQRTERSIRRVAPRDCGC